ncbi:hypothetical protein [uncultured Pseudodesulfovibrio sp.]|uniref:hypothetical protein n=1 Tax=uncultured Pseudodesulfovibrio sp. TaxID=2035858 RepID=UPI0029C73837|nr:hypothetical protein [uncultured Pseudodesulfovibrio sp.]
MESRIHALKKELNTTKQLWWLHDSYWHATMIRELGEERANQLNLEANERFFRKYTLMLLRSKAITRPTNIQELMDIFKRLWTDCFFDDLYVNDTITFEGNTATWTGCHCHAYDSLTNAKMTDNYACGCQAIRTGAMKALRLNPVHSIKKSLIRGDDHCVITTSFEPKA